MSSFGFDLAVWYKNLERDPPGHNTSSDNGVWEGGQKRTERASLWKLVEILNWILSPFYKYGNDICIQNMYHRCSWHSHRCFQQNLCLTFKSLENTSELFLFISLIWKRKKVRKRHVEDNNWLLTHWQVPKWLNPTFIHSLLLTREKPKKRPFNKHNFKLIPSSYPYPHLKP